MDKHEDLIILNQKNITGLYDENEHLKKSIGLLEKQIDENEQHFYLRQRKLHHSHFQVLREDFFKDLLKVLVWSVAHSFKLLHSMYFLSYD